MLKAIFGIRKLVSQVKSCNRSKIICTAEHQQKNLRHKLNLMGSNSTIIYGLF